MVSLDNYQFDKNEGKPVNIFKENEVQSSKNVFAPNVASQYTHPFSKRMSGSARIVGRWFKGLGRRTRMKRKMPKLYQYRLKRGFFLFPRWCDFKSFGDSNAIHDANQMLDFDNSFFRLQYSKLKLQRLVKGEWVEVKRT